MYFDDTDNGIRSKRKRCANCKDMYAATIQVNMQQISWNIISVVWTTRKSNGNSRKTDKR